MDATEHAKMSREVRDALKELAGKPLGLIAAGLARVVSFEYAAEKAASAAEHWTETFRDRTTPADAKGHALDACRDGHFVWAEVARRKAAAVR